jgi:hypothetical protein
MKTLFSSPRYLVLLAAVSFVTGCASLQETGKKIWGSSISHLEAARSTGLSLEVSLKTDDAFQEIQAILEKSGATVYLKHPKEHMLAAMNFSGHVDTTEVGIFLTSQENGGTKIEIASMSPSLAEQVSRLLSEGLNPKGEEGAGNET